MGVKIVLILIVMGAVSVLTRAACKSYMVNISETDDNTDTRERDCPVCGFHVQLGDNCIYCGPDRPVPD